MSPRQIASIARKEQIELRMEVKRKASVVEKVLSEHRRHSNQAGKTTTVTGHNKYKAASPMKSGRLTDMDHR